VLEYTLETQDHFWAYIKMQFVVNIFETVIPSPDSNSRHPVTKLRFPWERKAAGLHQCFMHLFVCVVFILQACSWALQDYIRETLEHLHVIVQLAEPETVQQEWPPGECIPYKSEAVCILLNMYSLYNTIDIQSCSKVCI